MQTETENYEDDVSSERTIDEVQEASQSESIVQRHENRRLSNKIDWTKFFGFKCYFNKIISDADEISKFLDAGTMEHLKATQFWNFLDMIISKKMLSDMATKGAKCIVDIIGMYTGEGNGFVFSENAEVVNLEPRDIALMFGIPLQGYTFDTSERGRHASGVFQARYFANKLRITKKENRSEMIRVAQKENKTENDRIDTVKLMILYSFSVFFFASTSGSLSKVIIKKYESLDNINNCSWPKMIHTF